MIMLRSQRSDIRLGMAPFYTGKFAWRCLPIHVGHRFVVVLWRFMSATVWFALCLESIFDYRCTVLGQHEPNYQCGKYRRHPGGRYDCGRVSWIKSASSLFQLSVDQ